MNEVEKVADTEKAVRRRSKKVSNTSDAKVKSAESSTKTIIDVDACEVSKPNTVPEQVQALNLDETSKPAKFKPTAGQKFTTKLMLLYRSSVSTSAFRSISGDFYAWDPIVHDGRLRVTDSPEGVGKIKSIIGWVNVSDIMA